jgi:hypothetical protein
MTEPSAGRAGVPAPTVGLSLPSHPAVDAALDQYRAAVQTHADSPTEETREAKAKAGNELRYQRWLARGGPAIEEAQIAQHEQAVTLGLDARDIPPRHTSRAAADLYARYDASREG